MWNLISAKEGRPRIRNTVVDSAGAEVPKHLDMSCVAICLIAPPGASCDSARRGTRRQRLLETPLKRRTFRRLSPKGNASFLRKEKRLRSQKRPRYAIVEWVLMKNVVLRLNELGMRNLSEVIEKSIEYI